MAASILLLAFALSAETSPAQVRADLDGQGGVEIATAAASGRRVRLEVRDARGTLLAQAAIPDPGGASRAWRSPRDLSAARARFSKPSPPRRAKRAGPCGVTATGASGRCHWRNPEGRFPIAIRTGPPGGRNPPKTRPRSTCASARAGDPTASCAKWRPSDGRASIWSSTPNAPGGRSTAWRFRPGAASRFTRQRPSDGSPRASRTQPRLEFLADRAEGRFEIRINGTDGEERLPVTAARPGQEKRERMLVAGPGTRVQVLLSSDGDVPLEARVQGDERRPDNLYRALAQQTDEGLRVYDSVERELAEEYLPGAWASEKETFPVTLVSASPPLLRFGNSDVSLTVVRAPEGVDALLLPGDGSLPYLGIRLEGPNALSRVPVRCQRAAGAAYPRCQAAGPVQKFRRVGARLNVR